MKHTLESCKGIAARYQTAGEWKTFDSASYQAAGRNGWAAECRGHMRAGKRGTKVGTRHVSGDEWLSKVRVKHGDKYDYSETVYRGSQDNVVVRCRTHGEFTQRADSHAQGIGCPRCGLETRAGSLRGNVFEFIKKARIVHGDRYDYSRARYSGNGRKLEIVCPKHGSFWQTPANHVGRGDGCPTCSGRNCDTLGFAEKARVVHGEAYDYSKVRYVGAHDNVEIICREHGSFFQAPSNHLQPNGCPKCAGVGPSRTETEVFKFVKAICGDAEQSVIGLLAGQQELDILIPSKKIAIEFNGLIWHSAKFGKSRQYHQRKTDSAAESGYRLIHIWSDEWRDKRAWCEAFLKMQLSGPERKFYARKCAVRLIGGKDGAAFHDTYHLQGNKSGKSVGVYSDEGELLAVATVRGDELARWTVKFGTVIVGGLSKVMRVFNQRIISYCDTAKHNGLGYVAAGFRLCETSYPSYHYTDGKTRVNRVRFQKHKLQAMKGAVGDTEKELAENMGFYQIGGCKQLRFEWLQS